MKRGRFTDDEVRRIRLSPHSVRVLAAEFGVSPTTIQRIRDRRAYKYVPDSPGDSTGLPMIRGLSERYVPTENESTRMGHEKVDGDNSFAEHLGFGETTAAAAQKLTDDQVREIRQSPRPVRALAQEFGVSHPTIIRVKKGLSYGNVPDQPEGITGRYERGYALDFLPTLPAGYCPTVVTSSPLFSMSNYSRRYMSRDEAFGRHIHIQLRVIRECIRVAGDEGIVLYHTGGDIKSELLQYYAKHEPSIGSDSPVPEIIVWDHITPDHNSSRWYNPSQDTHTTESFILVFKGRRWTLPTGSLAKAPLSGDIWEMNPMDEDRYARRADDPIWRGRYSDSTYQRYLRRWWYTFPDTLADRCISLGVGRVLDPFAGAGVIPLAAIRAGRPWLAYDTRSSLMDIFFASTASDKDHEKNDRYYGWSETML